MNVGTVQISSCKSSCTCRSGCGAKSKPSMRRRAGDIAGCTGVNLESSINLPGGCVARSRYSMRRWEGLVEANPQPSPPPPPSTPTRTHPAPLSLSRCGRGTRSIARRPPASWSCPTLHPTRHSLLSVHNMHRCGYGTLNTERRPPCSWSCPTCCATRCRGTLTTACSGGQRDPQHVWVGTTIHSISRWVAYAARGVGGQGGLGGLGGLPHGHITRSVFGARTAAKSLGIP